MGYLVGLIMLVAAVYDGVLPLGRPNGAVPPNGDGTMPLSPINETHRLHNVIKLKTGNLVLF